MGGGRGGIYDVVLVYKRMKSGETGGKEKCYVVLDERSTRGNSASRIDGTYLECCHPMHQRPGR